MIHGKCPRCGSYHVGEALRYPLNQECSRCGTWLVISEKKTFKRITLDLDPEEIEETPPD